jgi:predicted SAM-dependent methyltransferase
MGYAKVTIIKSVYTRFPRSARNRIHLILNSINRIVLLHLLFGPILNLFFRKKLLKKSSEELYLRVGESRKFDGWISSNKSIFTFNYLDLTKKSMPPNIIQGIYADNVIEHLNQEDTIKFLKNSLDLLVPGGKIRLATPDAETIIKAYLENDLEKLRQAQSVFAEHALEVSSHLDLLHVTFAEFGHEKGKIYDFSEISLLLKDIGFCNVNFCHSSESDDRRFRNLESRNGSFEKWAQMCIEAEKFS